MSWTMPDYLSVSAAELGQNVSVGVRILGDLDSISQDMAQNMLDAAGEARSQGHAPTFIIPVGPVGQFAVLAERINRDRIDCRDWMLINMDEYLTDDDHWIDSRHPLSFRGFMNRNFYDRIDPRLAPMPENRIFPDPAAPEALQTLVDARSGIDICYGGIGINGHIAFNEPPEPGEDVSVESFAALPTRSLDLSRETKTINSVTVGGEISLVPRRAVTVGMKEILAARKLRFYCNRPWQRGVVRRVLHGPLASAYPASFLQTHPDAEIAVADYVAEPPEIQLR